MADLGTLTAQIENALHAYLAADPDTTDEVAAWQAYLAVLDTPTRTPARAVHTARAVHAARAVYAV
jgi:anti-sigma-K factor RskA